MSNYYYEDGSPKQCRNCGCESFKDVYRSVLSVLPNGDGPPMEIEYFCFNCGASVAYWAYGSFDPSYLDGPK